jgi:hypothetical protein
MVADPDSGHYRAVDIETFQFALVVLVVGPEESRAVGSPGKVEAVEVAAASNLEVAAVAAACSLEVAAFGIADIADIVGVADNLVAAEQEAKVLAIQSEVAAEEPGIHRDQEEAAVSGILDKAAALVEEEVGIRC